MNSGNVGAGADGNWTEYMKAFSGRLYRPDVAPADAEETIDETGPSMDGADAEQPADTAAPLKISNPLFESAAGRRR